MSYIPITVRLEGEGEERCVGECLFSRNGALRLEDTVWPCFATPTETSLVSMSFFNHSALIAVSEEEEKEEEWTISRGWDIEMNEVAANSSFMATER